MFDPITTYQKQLMQNQLKPIAPRNNVRHSRVIRFWSDGEMAESAFNRLTELRKDKREEEARVLLDEWIV